VADARAAAATLAEQVAAAAAAHPNGRWQELLGARLLTAIARELDARAHGPQGERVSLEWRRREGAFYAHLENVLRPTLYPRVCVVLFDAIQQRRAPT
jgi:hypothetical protein